MTKKPQRYLSYLLRLWQTSDDGEQIWRASLESPGTGERQGFASIEDLIDFLRDRTGSGGEENDALDSEGASIVRRGT
jgi:hypothetical protein